MDELTFDGRRIPINEGASLWRIECVVPNEAELGDIDLRSRFGGGHVGLVVGRSGSGQIITIEGNSSSDDITSWNGGAVVQHD